MRSGRQYLEGLRDGRTVWLAGARVDDVTEHPALRGCARTLAALFDAQHDPAQAALMTIESPSGGRAGAAWRVPRCPEDLAARRALIEHLCRQQGGTMGRLPDYVPLILLGLYAARGLTARANPGWASNLERYWELCRDRDLVLAHSFADAQIDRSRPSGALGHLAIVARDERHLVVRGMKTMATLAPLADEYLVLTPPRAGIRADQVLFFAVPVATPGLRLYARAPLAGGDPADQPLAARFDEMDAAAQLDDVRVPRERVFLAEDTELQAACWRQVNVFAYHHILVRMAVKAELFAGVASLVARQLGTAAFERVRDDLAELVRYLETLRAFVRAAEADPVTTRGGVVMPNPRTLMVGHLYAVEHHARLVQTLIGLCGQSLITVPTEDDLRSAELRGDLERVFAEAPGALGDRIRLFRLARELTCTPYASRQLLFEQFNGRDLPRNRQALFAGYDLAPHEALARRLAGIGEGP